MTFIPPPVKESRTIVNINLVELSEASSSDGKMVLGKRPVVSYFPKKLNMTLVIRCMTLEATVLGFKELVQDESKTKEV